MARLQSPQLAHRPRVGIGGFTLVEVVTALSLLSIGAIALTGTFVEAVRAGNTSGRRQTAVLLAHKKLAELRTVPLEEMGEISGRFAEPFSQYHWQLIAEPDREGRLLNIWLKVSYQAETASATVSAMTTVLVAQP